MPRTLYICYFGLLEPLVQTQVLPYLCEIKKDGVGISIVTFEPDFRNKWSEKQIEEERRKLAAEGIDWHYLAYHKWPSVPATLYDIFRGTLFVRRFIRTHKPDILHGRAHLPTLMGAIARKFSRHKPKVLFDIRGLFPEEYTDAGIWPEGGWLYRGAKRVERWLMKESDGFVILTEKARELLFAKSKDSGFDQLGRPVEVIPCCINFERFKELNASSREKIRKKLKIENRFVVAYVGSLGGWYLTNETSDFLGELKSRQKDVFALILTQSRPEIIKRLLEEQGYISDDYFISQVLPSEVPFYLAGADVAVSFIKKCYSKQASSPTKNAEYLACGLPIIANSGVGDVDDLIEGKGVGVTLKELEKGAYAKAFEKITALIRDNGFAEHCKKVAFEHFDLGIIGGERYRRLYRNLLKEK
jgi:Glycosyltransferase